MTNRVGIVVCCLVVGGLAGACHKSRMGDEPETSTETGNPPVLDGTLIALVVSHDEIAVVGEPGAVSPGGAEVEVEVLSSGEVYRATSNEDGSFEVEVEGLPDDLFTVRVAGADAGTGDGGVYIYQGGATVESEGLDTLSCDLREELYSAQLDAADAAADRSCSGHDDCVRGPTTADCYYPPWFCGGPAVSREGYDELETALARVVPALCESYDRDMCWLGKPMPGCSPRPPVACVDSRCVSCDEEDCSQLSCDDCGAEPLVWTDSFAARTDTFRVSNCSQFSFEGWDGFTCQSELPCATLPECEDCSTGSGHAALELAAALKHPDVLAALEDETFFGPQNPAGDVFSVGVGDRSFAIGGGDCAASVADCVDPPEGVRFLQSLLEDIALQQDCRPVVDLAACAPQQAQWSGDCEPEAPFYWFGSYCGAVTGCECTGDDCGAGFATMEACIGAHEGCEAITTACGGFAGPTCTDSEYCAYAPGLFCGALDAGAICEPRPEQCGDGNVQPVCGCDGVTYNNPCEAALAGTGFSSYGDCP